MRRVGSAEREDGALRVAVVDMGTNTTRLLVADVADGHLSEVERRTRVTGLGRGVDLSAQLCSEGIDEVCEAVREYIAVYEELGADRLRAIATSAVRDAENADAFVAELRERFALDSTILDGDEEARLTYRGARGDRHSSAETLVVDIGGGSTELIIGSGPEPSWSTSLQCGTVRHTERYLRSDPPGPEQLEDLAADVRGLIDTELPAQWRPDAGAGIAVAGTPTSLAAIELELDPHDRDAVHGHRMTLGAIQRRCSELASMPLELRREVIGLHPGRAPTIVAGVVILIQVMRAFDLDRIEVSERDILHGAAVEAAQKVPS
jgi:exopolyphosphatase / guanosine-5'-triphosphate,3'-diphosphate pyrophosphatase